uniref:PH domain-containing protein n=1 Tax=Cebus imitator TaxID=2715852 RepID=A0A2K5RFX3_CEBIM
GSLRDELLKAIWHAFIALDHDHSGKVTKSQLKVLSHNLCMVLKVPHDPVALEEHFRDDDEGSVSNQGYMPYLNKFILGKVQDNFDKIEFHRLCRTLCVKKKPHKESPAHYRRCQISVNYLKMVLLHGNLSTKAWIDRLCLWQLMKSLMNFILDVLKQGYMMKKGHRQKNWTERWFVLKRNIISYYVSEDLNDKKGDILLDENCCLESLLLKLVLQKKKQEWIQAIHSTIHPLKLGSPPPHKEAQHRLKELQKKQLELQATNESKQLELEAEAASRAAEEEKKRLQTQVEFQARFSTELEREKLIRQQVEEQVAQKSSEVEQYLQRVRELEDMYLRLEETLEDERQAQQDEETVRKLQARLLEEESSKRAELEKWHLEQQQAIQMTEAEKQELENQCVLEERALQEAMEQLEQERKQALEQYKEVKKKLEMAPNKTKSWKDKEAHHEGLIRLIEPASENPHLITNWGPAAFTEAELEEKELEREKDHGGTGSCLD